MLTEVHLPSTLIEIGNLAFGSCTALTNMKIPDGVSYIGNSAFSGCCSWIGTFPIGPNTESIGRHAFSNCSSLTGKVIIPEGITEIKEYTFYGCSGLTKIVIPDSVASIAEQHLAIAVVWITFHSCISKKIVCLLGVMHTTPVLVWIQLLVSRV